MSIHNANGKKDINPKFGGKIEELFDLINEVEDWEQYVTEKTANVVKYLYKCQSMLETEQHFDMKYTTVRAHLLRAISRISERRTDFKREAKSDQALELFEIIDNTPNWKDFVTDNEAMLAEKFREVKSFYELGRMLDLVPGNIAGTLYGSTQKLGVIGKIKQGIPQTDRRDIDKRREEAE